METSQELLRKGFLQLGVAHSDSVIAAFITYLRELKKWNRAYNLTALESERDIIIKHFFDSLLYLTFIEEEKSICDVGSGAGFPGIPLAIVRPELAITLVEPSRKKCAFLKHLRRTLGLSSLEIIESRIEDVQDRSFDIILTRALFSIEELIKKAGHLLNRDGFFLLSKGPKLDEETKGLSPSLHYEVKTVPLPFTSLVRNLVKVSKRHTPASPAH